MLKNEFAHFVLAAPDSVGAAGTSMNPSSTLETTPSAAAAGVERWGVFEIEYPGPTSGNPFTDISFSAAFQHGAETITAEGFYDGEGIYRIRFMPDSIGDWTYVTQSNCPELTGKTGSFTVIPPSSTNHGPVHVLDKYHFLYADGTPYKEIGTTCYAWTSQTEALQEQTLKTLATAPFNKIRMCIFPKWYAYNEREPSVYPYAGVAPNQWDFTKFNPLYFQHFEKRVEQLREMGIEADIILFHPYDEGHWGFDRMGVANDDLYLRYVVARLSAYRNVWWSIVNEWDLVRTKTVDDWSRLGGDLMQKDPYHHLCSIHQCVTMFDQNAPWITHISHQNDRPEEAWKILDLYDKPLIYDECRYEGNITQDWGCITPERMTQEFWTALTAGAWCGHSETYMGENIWWSHGGTLVGHSIARLAFFKRIVAAAPAKAAPLKAWYAWGVEGSYYLIYLRDFQPCSWNVTLPNETMFHVDVIDTWEMAVHRLPDTFAGQATIPLPSKPYQAILLTAVKS